MTIHIDALNPEEMARWMLEALKTEMHVMTETNREQLRPLLNAIAQGVIKHLKDNPGAFKFSGQVSGGSCTGQVDEISTDGLEEGW